MNKEGESVWLTQKQIAALIDVSVPTVNEHLSTLYEQREIERGATVRDFRIVQKEGSREGAFGERGRGGLDGQRERDRGDFVVFTADMRHSTKHLMVAESRLKPGVTPLKRVFIETFVLLLTLAEIVSLGNGKVKNGEKPVVRFSQKRLRDCDGHKLDYLQSA